MAKTLTPELIFGDDKLKLIEFSSIFANPDWLATVIFYFILISVFWLVARSIYVALKEHRLDQRMFSGVAFMAAAILLIAPLLPVQWALELPSRLGIPSVVAKDDSIQRNYSTIPIGLGQWMIVAGYTLSDLFANQAALKLVSLNPLTAPQMPLLKSQAKRYFENSDEVNQVALTNIHITGGAFSERDFQRHVIDGAGVAYASAGLNHAGHTRQDIPSMPDSGIVVALGGDTERVKRLAWMWSKNEPAAMAECVGNTMVSDYAFALNLAKSSSNDNQYAEYPNLPVDTQSAWNDYYSKAAAYLYAGAGSGPSSSSFGARWSQQARPDGAGSDVQLPPVSDILKDHSIRERILNAETFRLAWAPGTDQSELFRSSKSVEAEMVNETDSLARANNARLLAAVRAREAAEIAKATTVENVSGAFEKIASAHAMATLSNHQVGGFLTLLENGISIPGGREVVKLINNDNAVGKCRAFGNRVKALNVSSSTDDLKPSGLKEKLSEFMGSLPDKGISAARQVASNGWMMLGVYYVSNARTYQDFFEAQNDLNEEAAAASVKYMDTSPVAAQAGDAGLAGEAAAAGSVWAMAALRKAGNKISEAGGAATKFAGTALGKVVTKIGILGILTALMNIWKDFAPYVAFVFVVIWWLLKLVAIFISMPYIILTTAGLNVFSNSDSPRGQWIVGLFRRLVVLVFMPVVYVIGWGVIFFGVSIIDVVIASTGGEASASGAFTSIMSGNFGQAAFMDTGVVQTVIKFVLGVAISMVLFKIEGWVVEFIGHGSTSEADMNAGPKPTDLNPGK